LKPPLDRIGWGRKGVTALSDPDPVVRGAALTALEPIPQPARLQVASGLLGDPIRAVRIEAARLLAASHAELRAGPHAKAFENALAEYRQSLDTLADRPGSHMGFGLLYSNLGDPARAEQAYRDAFRIDPSHIESRINLAELLFQQDRTPESGALLKECVRLAPDRGVAHEALGRHFVRMKDYHQALVWLSEAARLMPDNAHIHYFYGVALNQLEQFEKALVPLSRAHELEPQSAEYLVGLATICRDHASWGLALGYAQKLVAIDPRYTEVYNSIEAQMRAQK